MPVTAAPIQPAALPLPTAPARRPRFCRLGAARPFISRTPRPLPGCQLLSGRSAGPGQQSQPPGTDPSVSSCSLCQGLNSRWVLSGLGGSPCLPSATQLRSGNFRGHPGKEVVTLLRWGRGLEEGGDTFLTPWTQVKRNQNRGFLELNPIAILSLYSDSGQKMSSWPIPDKLGYLTSELRVSLCPSSGLAWRLCSRGLYRLLASEGGTGHRLCLMPQSPGGTQSVSSPCPSYPELSRPQRVSSLVACSPSLPTSRTFVLPAPLSAAPLLADVPSTYHVPLDSVCPQVSPERQAAGPLLEPRATQPPCFSSVSPLSFPSWKGLHGVRERGESVLQLSLLPKAFGTAFCP